MDELLAYCWTEPRSRKDQAVWVISEDDPAGLSARQVAMRANARQRQPHLVWNPATGELIKMLDYGAKNHLYPMVHPGSDMLGILVVALPEKPFTDYPQVHRKELLETVRESGVEADWPFGPPTEVGMTSSIVDEAGHYSACQLVPDQGHGHIGQVDTRSLT